MKRILTLLAGIFAALAALAVDITEEQARTVAENFVAKDAVGMRALPGRAVDAVTKRGGLWLVSLKPSGHLLVSANRAAEPIPAFSENDFVAPAEGSPQSVLLALAETNALNAVGTKYETRWRTLLGERMLRLTTSSADETTYVAPLLQSSWSQDTPYCDYAPVQNGVHDPNGCVSTAYSQIMRYWEWPEKIDEDVATEHLADSAWGFKQQLWAGTELNWSEMPLSWYANERDRMNIGRATMLCGMIAKMSYAGTASKAQNSDVTRNPWYATPNGLDSTGGNSEELKAAIKASLKAKCPFVVSIGNPNHSIVGDGCSESAGTFYVHLNYGWGGMSTQDYTMEYLVGTSELSGIYPNQRPNPMVQVDSMNAESALPLTLGWAFPKNGYEDALDGFTIKYAEVGTTVSDWMDDFSGEQGVVSGDDMAVTTLGCDNTTPVLHIGNEAMQSHYTWPAKFVRADSVLSFRIRSSRSRGMKVQVQVYNPSTGWEDVCVPTLADDETIDWQELAVPLAKYADKAVGLRVKALRVSKQSIEGGEDTGVQFDDFKITNVRDISSSVESIEVGKDARSYSFTSAKLSEGKTYVFTVEPKVAGGIASPSVSTKIVSAAPSVASIDAITSVRKTGHQVQQGFYREGYLGLNQFGVYGSDATTGLVVRLSHPVLIDKSTPYFDTVDQKYGVTIGATSVVHAVSVEKVRNGKFLVKLDFGMLTEYAKTTRMMVTFDALDSKGNIARKHFNLLLNNLGGEAAITANDLPDYAAGGDEPGGDPIVDPPSGDDPVVDPPIGDEPVAEPTNGNPNDFTEGNVNYRFCNGVNKTGGWYDMKTQSTYAHKLPPISFDLMLWWVDRYKAANGGSAPSGYMALMQDDVPSSNNNLSMAQYTATLANWCSDKTKYFPSSEIVSADWYGDATGDSRAAKAGRHIYVALAKGPIGVTMDIGYCVVWGCEYATADNGEKYATYVWATDTKTRDNSISRYQLKSCLQYNDDVYGTPAPRLVAFSSGINGLIQSYYPIVGPAISEEDPDEPDDDPVVPTMFTVQFESVGAPAAVPMTVEGGKMIGTLPTIERDGWNFLGWRTAAGDEVTEKTVVTADVTFYAQWEEVGEEPDDPDEPTPDDPSGKIGAADTTGDPGKFYTGYGYTMCDNYWTARKRAIAAKKHLFILSGASWCSNCSFVKDCLKELGAAFSDKFVVYFSDHDSTTCNYFNGGLPQYGAADPRKVDAFSGTLNGSTRSWDLAWQKPNNGIFAQDRGGYAPERVKSVVNSANGKSVGTPTNLVIRGLATLGTGTEGRYELVAQFDDGVEMVVDHGVAWSVSGSGTIASVAEEGSAAGRLRISAGTVRVTATSTFYFTGSAKLDVSCAPESDIEAVEIVTDEVNLEDDLTPTIEAVATLKNGKTIPVSGFGKWTATFVRQIPREDPELEESSTVALNPNVSVDSASRLTYSFASDDALVEVCDQVVTLTLTVNGKTATKDIRVWGPTKVAPSKWKMISGPRQTTLGVVRLSCTELKYNYGGKIYTTTDTYFASYETVLQCGIASHASKLRGLTAYVDNYGSDKTYTVGLRATKVNGKYKGYAPEKPEESSLATNVTCLARGSYKAAIEKGLVPEGFFKAFFPNRTDYAALADEDSDGDGFKNWEEYVLGTDPTNANDAFTLMQGYQHLTAPAENGDTMQYKVMYQQRARRIYYIDAKEAWCDEWTHVATVSLANMAEKDVTTFGDLNADYANGAKFFRVRAALYEHDFDYPKTKPVIEPKMLVAAPGSVIDLSDGSALNLTSFDTDATDAGTVWVKVPANVAIGTALITVPKVAEKSLKACVAQNLSADKVLVVEATANGKLALKVAWCPTLEEGKGTIVISGDEIVVSPDDGVTEISIANVGNLTVVLPPAVDKVIGVADKNKVVVKNGTHDVTKAMKFTQVANGFAIALDGDKVVTVGGEDIPVRPTLADAKESPLAVDDAALSLGVKTIPGLLYQLLKVDLALGKSTTVGEPQLATGARLTLEAERTAEPSAFYTIQVCK